MNTVIDMSDSRKAEARQSPAGLRLTDSQFDKTWAICGIVGREIQKSGPFVEVLSDFAHAFARTERFDAMRAEEIVRDLFKVRFGQSMNQMREDLMKREDDIRPAVDGDALRHARSIPILIREAPTMPFYRAYDQAAVAFAGEFGITEAGAKEMMKTAFAAHEGRELYDAGKEAEALHYKPSRPEQKEDGGKPDNRVRRQRSWSRS